MKKLRHGQVKIIKPVSSRVEILDIGGLILKLLLLMLKFSCLEVYYIPGRETIATE